MTMTSPGFSTRVSDPSSISSTSFPVTAGHMVSSHSYPRAQKAAAYSGCCGRGRSSGAGTRGAVISPARSEQRGQRGSHGRGPGSRSEVGELEVGAQLHDDAEIAVGLARRAVRPTRDA